MDKRGALIRLALAAPFVGGTFAAGHHLLLYAVGGDAALAPMLAEAGQDRGGYAGAALLGARTGWWVGALVTLPALVLGYRILRRGSTLYAVGAGVIAFGVLAATLGMVLGLATGMSLPGLNAGAFASPEGRAALMYTGAGWGAISTFPVGLYIMVRARRIDPRP